MSSRVVYCFAAYAILLSYYLIFPVKGQCTVEGCENGDSSINIVTQIQQLFVEAIHQLQSVQVRSINELLNASFQQMSNHLQDTVITSRPVIDRSPEQDVCINQVQSFHGLLNASFQQLKNLNTLLQQMKNQQDTVMTSLQAVDRRTQEQDTNIKQIQSSHGLLSASLQQLKNQVGTVVTSLHAVDRRSQQQDIYIKQIQTINGLLNSSFQQMKSKQDTAITSLQTVDRRLREHDISIKNQTQNSWKLALGIPVQVEIDIGLGQSSVLLPIVNNWIVLMHRFDRSLNFSRSWIEYRNGFGEIGRGEFWLGNEKVHRLTNRIGAVYTLRIEVQLDATGRWYYADYATFSLDSESSKYALRLSGFSGNAGDSLTNTSLGTFGYHLGMSFSTWDNENGKNPRYKCAGDYRAGWWFNACFHSCLTCPYGGNYFKWFQMAGWQTSGILRAARMMIKPV